MPHSSRTDDADPFYLHRLSLAAMFLSCVFNQRTGYLTMLPFPIIVLSLVFLLTALRQVFFRKLRIWQIMAMGASTVLIAGQIGVVDAAKAVNMDVMLFLFGMFVIGSALEESGYLYFISYKMFR